MGHFIDRQGTIRACRYVGPADPKGECDELSQLIEVTYVFDGKPEKAFIGKSEFFVNPERPERE